MMLRNTVYIMADEDRYKTFEQYLAPGKPDVEGRARNWSMAIGL